MDRIKAKAEASVYYVVHPLDDVHEQKRSLDELGVMPMTPKVRGALFAIQAYLVVMLSLVAYHAFVLAHMVQNR